MARAVEESVVLVVGGGRGLGRAVVEAFAERGAEVVVADTDELPSAVNQYRSRQVGGFAAACALAEELRGRGARVTAQAADAADPEAVDRLLTAVEDSPGRLDVVVNAFGITHVAPVERMELAEFEAVLRGNLTGVFVVSRRALPLLRRSGGGAIVNFSSISGRTGFAKVAHYCAAKFGVVGFTAALAREVAAEGIRVNAVCPGIVRTGMWDYLLDEFTRPGEDRETCWERMRAMVPQGECQSPADVAELAVFLATAERITGQAVSVDGGMYGSP